MEHLDAIIGGLDGLHEDAVVMVMGGGDERLVGGRAKWHLRDKMLRLQHIIDTSNTKEQELLRVVGRPAKRVTFDRRQFDDSRPNVQPGSTDSRLVQHTKVMKILRSQLARTERQVILDAAHEYNLMEPLILATGALVAMLAPFVTKRAPPEAKTQGGRIKTGPKMAAMIEELYNPHISRARRDEGAEKFSYDVVAGAGIGADAASSNQSPFAIIDFMLGLLPPSLDGKWTGSNLPAMPEWPADELKTADAGLEKRRAALEADAAEHEPKVAEHTECPCLISRRFVLGVLEIEQALEPHITAIENYYVAAAKYVVAIHAAVEIWMHSAAQPRRAAV